MCWLAGLFDDIGGFFRYIGNEFWDLGWWFYYTMDWETPGDFCFDAADFFWDIKRAFYYAADEIDDWWDEISEIVSDLNSLYNYAHGWLRDLAYDAYNYAAVAFAYADEALATAQSALQEVPLWILDKLTLAFNLASTALQEIPAWITTQLGELQGGLDSLFHYAHTTVWNKAIEAWNYAANAWSHAEELVSGLWTDVVAWVNSVLASMENFVNGVEADIRAWAVGMVDDALAAFAIDISAAFNVINVWIDSIQGFFNDPLEWLWAKFTDWFLGPE